MTSAVHETDDPFVGIFLNAYRYFTTNWIQLLFRYRNTLYVANTSATRTMWVECIVDIIKWTEL